VTTLLRSALLALALALLAGACADDATEETAAEEPAPEVTEDTPEATPPGDDEAAATPPDEDEAPDEETPADDDVSVMTAETDLGEVLVDGAGMTLYMFEPDEAGESTCYDACAQSWPPLLADEPTAAAGAEAALVGTTERDDGTMQVTYDGWPLYYWAGDEEPGDANGQGVNEVWWVLAADGAPVRGDDAGDDDAGGGGPGY
jgi:predicted lipoprotein with Yx(FWY)xxD motif